MLWKKSGTLNGDATAAGQRRAPTAVSPLRPVGRDSARRDTAQEDAAIDTIVSALRTLGRHQLDVGDPDTSQLARQFEAWAAHLAIGGPHPEHLKDARDDSPPVLPRERDWLGARRFVQAQREQECELVTRTVSHSHELIWDLTDGMAKTLLDTQERDREVLEQLERLRVAISTRSLSTLEQEATEVARFLTSAIKEREQRLQGQLEELGSRVSDLAEQLQEVKLESRLDALTRVPNRAAFDRAIRRWHHLGSAFRRPTTLILVDLDHLKPINDQYGHRAGDAALRVFADNLARCFPRRSDFVGRYGGDEFVVLLAETDARSGLRLAERFRQQIRVTPIDHEGQPLGLTASLGLAELDPSETIESWIDRADQALYEAKQAGRDRVAFARPLDVPMAPPHTASGPTEKAS